MYLFVAEKIGRRDSWTVLLEAEPDLSESPLSRKNNTGSVPAQNEKPPSRPPSPSPSPEPTLEDKILQLTVRQVYLVSTYRFNEESGTHQQCTRFHIRPRADIPNQFHSSLEFSHAIHALETEVRKCDRYAANPNDDVACELRAWALAMVAIRDQQAVTGESAFDKRKRKKRRIEEGFGPQPSTSSLEIPAVPDVDIEMPAIDPIPSPPRQLSPAPAPPPQPEFTAAGRPVRAKRKTWKLLQRLPEPAPLVISDPTPDPEPAPEPQPATATWVWNTIRTTINSFGLYREYPSSLS
ncbi:hypothetical protein B0H14DRAFT_3448836 [Mycena olivaceomarginata]|nr:hypothetical protein B0H14DRAFT_3448836 [Mycena olivaceomarginata]